MLATFATQPVNQTPVWEKQLRIQASQLRLGHHVSNLDVSWNDSPFTFQGVLLKKPTQLQWIQENCYWVIIDLNKSQIRPGTKIPKEISLTDNKKPITRHSMKSALKSYVGLEREVSTVIKSLRSGQFISTERMKETIDVVASQLFDHGPALIWLTHIKSKDNYTAEHCLNVAILAMGLAHSLGWKQNQIREAGLAGLLHDIGKTLIPTSILNKPGNLNEDEFDMMKQHTTKGFNIISRDSALSEDVKQAALHHHERPDGTGYPDKLAKHQISKTAALISIVDAYDAITSNRCYQKARNHHLALGILWKGRDSQFNAEMVEAFISWIGWVSPGTVVKLTTGERAIVIMANSGNRLQPTVRILDEYDGGFKIGPIAILSAITDGDGKSVFISSVLNSSEAKVDMRDLARQMLMNADSELKRKKH
jgi:putative nucleotidyltransferase with HDIG domain